MPTPLQPRGAARLPRRTADDCLLYPSRSGGRRLVVMLQMLQLLVVPHKVSATSAACPVLSSAVHTRDGLLATLGPRLC